LDFHYFFQERIVPPDPINAIEKKNTLNRLNQVIQHRLVTTRLPAQMRNLKVKALNRKEIKDNNTTIVIKLHILN
jgi:hypothetical protein